MQSASRAESMVEREVVLVELDVDAPGPNWEEAARMGATQVATSVLELKEVRKEEQAALIPVGMSGFEVADADGVADEDYKNKSS